MLITPEYVALNKELHQRNPFFGTNSGKDYYKIVKELAALLKTQDILDYGCGKGHLKTQFDFPLHEYDPAIPGKDQPPEPADIVVCGDVLEHIEPELLDNVLADLARCVKKVGLFIVPTHAASKTLADGRNTHLTQKPKDWWVDRVGRHFKIHDVVEVPCLMRNEDMFWSGSRIFFMVRPC